MTTERASEDGAELELPGPSGRGGGDRCLVTVHSGRVCCVQVDNPSVYWTRATQGPDGWWRMPANVTPLQIADATGLHGMKVTVEPVSATEIKVLPRGAFPVRRCFPAWLLIAAAVIVLVLLLWVYTFIVALPHPS